MECVKRKVVVRSFCESCIAAVAAVAVFACMRELPAHALCVPGECVFFAAGACILAGLQTRDMCKLFFNNNSQ